MNQHNTQLVILDFDGTLADTRPVIIGSMQRTIAEFGLPSKSEDECASVIGLPLRQCFVRLLGVSDEVADQCAERYRQIFDRLNTPSAVRLYPHVYSTLSALHQQGLQLAICSSRGRPTLEAYVDSLGLRTMVGLVVSADDVVNAKPHPEPVLRILEALHVRASEALVVGDASFDILMGRAAGCRTCGVSYGNQSAAELLSAGADAVIDSFADLQSLV